MTSDAPIFGLVCAGGGAHGAYQVGASSTALLFHRDFVRPLIELGYDDALARHDELAEFFGRA